MNRKMPQCSTAAIAFTLLWSLGNGTLGVNDDERKEVTRLAEVTHWKAGSIVADVGAGDRHTVS
jgi:hypothetical protein